MAHILIVDDEPRIRALIREHLEFSDFTCDEATDGSAALAQLTTTHFDLMVLDVMMPYMDGFACLREMRMRGLVIPVIMLSARGEEYDKLTGLEGGADDYIVKPFSPRELVARIKAVLARTMPKTASATSTINFDPLQIDLACHLVTLEGATLNLTPKEFDLLVFLASNPDVAHSRERILEKVWNFDYYGEDRTVDTHIKMLRNHLNAYRHVIATVWGIGYKFDSTAL